MRLFSWNVNGFRAILKKGFEDILKQLDPDVIGLQETKVFKGFNHKIDGYYEYFFSGVKSGYSGVAVFTKIKPLNVIYGINCPEIDDEGRVLTLEFDNFYFVTAYTPNAQEGLKRMDYRSFYENKMLEYLAELDKNKPVVLCGDLNVAHKPIDLKNPQANEGNPGYSPQEREHFSNLLSSGYKDTYRHFYPDKIEEYTWWTYRFKARDRNIGWRIDYFVVSDRFINNIEQAEIHQEIYGSDHCPVMIKVKV